MKINRHIRDQLIPNGILRVGLNMANKLLVSGTTSAGNPDGVAPDLARELAKQLSVDISLIKFSSPGEVADMTGKNYWDIGMIGDEPERAKIIDFSKSYVEIEATYMVTDESSFLNAADIDQKHVRIAVSSRSAYDLYLSRHLKNATLVRAKGVPAAVSIFKNDGLDALAGLRPALTAEVKNISGTRVVDGKFTSVQQAIGVEKGKSQAAKFINQFVEKARSSGLIHKLIDKHGLTDRLSVGTS